MRVEFSDERIAELRQMAAGARPFTPDAVLDKLFDLPLAEHRKFAPRERLAVGYYAAAMRRRDMLAGET